MLLCLQDTLLTPGQTVWLRFPAVSLLESHPFSVADVNAQPEGDSNLGPTCTVHMRVRDATSLLPSDLLAPKVVRPPALSINVLLTHLVALHTHTHIQQQQQQKQQQQRDTACVHLNAVNLPDLGC